MQKAECNTIRGAAGLGLPSSLVPHIGKFPSGSPRRNPETEKLGNRKPEISC